MIFRESQLFKAFRKVFQGYISSEFVLTETKCSNHSGKPYSELKFQKSRAENQLSANPTKGHLSVVGWTSTPVWGEAKNLFKPLVVFLSWRRPY